MLEGSKPRAAAHTMRADRTARVVRRRKRWTRMERVDFSAAAGARGESSPPPQKEICGRFRPRKSPFRPDFWGFRPWQSGRTRRVIGLPGIGVPGIRQKVPVRQALEKRDEILLFLLRQGESGDERAPRRAGDTAARVVIDHVSEAREAAVVHVRAGHRDVAQRGNPGEAGLRLPRRLPRKTPAGGVHRESVVGEAGRGARASLPDGRSREGEPRMAAAAEEAFGEKERHPPTRRIGHRGSVVAPHEAVVCGVSREDGPLERRDGLLDVLERDGASGAGKRLPEEFAVERDVLDAREHLSLVSGQSHFDRMPVSHRNGGLALEGSNARIRPRERGGERAGLLMAGRAGLGGVAREARIVEEAASERDLRRRHGIARRDAGSRKSGGQISRRDSGRETDRDEPAEKEKAEDGAEAKAKAKANLTSAHARASSGTRPARPAAFSRLPTGRTRRPARGRLPPGPFCASPPICRSRWKARPHAAGRSGRG